MSSSRLTLALGVVLLLAGCSTGDNADVVVTVLTTSSTVAPPPVTMTPSAVSSSPVTPTGTPEPPVVSTPEASKPPVSSTEASTVPPGFDPAVLPDLPPPDRDTPGPVGGSVCTANTAYWDETTDGLDPNTVAAWEAAKVAGTTAGVVLCLNDGKRSNAQQEQTYQDYVTEYGTGAAQTYVLPPEKSEHVAGYAIDVQPAPAYQWLERTNGAFGLCRIYEVEPWHFEFDKSYAAGCPVLLPGPVTAY